MKYIYNLGKSYLKLKKKSKVLKQIYSKIIFL